MKRCATYHELKLELDHLNGIVKDIAVMAGQGYSIAAIQKEIDKCQVLCANCHRKKTAKEKGWFSG